MKRLLVLLLLLTMPRHRPASSCPEPDTTQTPEVNHA